MPRWCERVHTWFPGAMRQRLPPSEQRRRCLSFPEEGLRLLVPDAPPSLDPLPLVEKIDPAVRGLHECASGAGIGTCTESLCCESCVGGMAAEDVAQMEIRAAAAAGEGVGDQSRRRARPGAKIKRGNEFPPPLAWLSGEGDGDGRRSRFMRAERRDGRLILTEARIERPPRVFRSRREDGRLRLDWIETEGEERARVKRPEGEEEETRRGRRISEGFRRCQGVAIGICGGGMRPGWNRRFVTTA